MSKIELRNVTKTYGDVVAVKDLDVSIEEGAYTMILGPSGSGKSTALRIIAGLTDPTEGRVVIDGEDVTDRSARERDLSMVFQHLALWDHKTVRENMGFGLQMQGVPADERNERIEEVAEMLEIADKLDQSPAALSGGQQQRVALGRSLVRRPDVILLDEPLASLDEQLRLRMRTELRRVQRETGTTFVHVTHSQEDAMTIADQILVLDGGELQQFGDAMDLYREPANEFVAGFIGTPTMNLVDASVAKRDGVVELGFARLSVPVSDDGRLGSAFENGSVRVGIRPEEFLIGREADVPGHSFDAEVSIVETFGDFNWYYLDVGEDELVVQSWDPAVINEVEEGDEVTVSVDPEAIHLFDPATGERIRT